MAKACLLQVICLVAASVSRVARSAEDRHALVPGETMPRLAANSFDGARSRTAGRARGRVALLGLGFSYDSRVPVEAWTARFRELYPPAIA